MTRLCRSQGRAYKFTVHLTASYFTLTNNYRVSTTTKIIQVHIVMQQSLEDFL